MLLIDKKHIMHDILFSLNRIKHSSTIQSRTWTIQSLSDTKRTHNNQANRQISNTIHNQLEWSKMSTRKENDFTKILNDKSKYV